MVLNNFLNKFFANKNATKLGNLFSYGKLQNLGFEFFSGDIDYLIGVAPTCDEIYEPKMLSCIKKIIQNVTKYYKNKISSLKTNP